jgi:meso-butanediol dehydrogenase/(S,S)-butanediol dehydrogenase/diacetyl reductase
MALTLDVSDQAALRRAFDDTISQLGGCGALVCAAGTKDSDWSRSIAVNLAGAASLARLAANALVRSGEGSSICFVGASGIGGGENAAYAAAKAGLNGLTRVLATDYGRRYGIRVNCVAPGPIDTPLLAAGLEGLGLAERQAALGLIAARIPLGRLGTAHSVATTIRYLLSDDAAFINGVTLVIDGGLAAAR